MAKYLFCIVMGFFLLSKLTSVFSDVGEDKQPHILTQMEYSLIEADEEQCEQGQPDVNRRCQADAQNVGYSIPSRHASPPQILRFNTPLLIAKTGRTLKILLPEEKTTSSPCRLNSFKTSCRYYVYTLRHILV